MPRIPIKRIGNSPSDTEWNALIDYLVSVQPVKSSGELMRFGPLGVSREPAIRGGAGGTTVTVTKYKLDSVQDDYLTCHSWDGTTEGTDPIYVAKPDELRTSLAGETKDGAPYTYTYSAGPDGLNVIRTSSTSGLPDENQLLSSPWILGGFIYAIDPVATDAVDGGSNPITKLYFAPFKIWTKVP